MESPGLDAGEPFEKLLFVQSVEEEGLGSLEEGRGSLFEGVPPCLGGDSVDSRRGIGELVAATLSCQVEVCCVFGKCRSVGNDTRHTNRIAAASLSSACLVELCGWLCGNRLLAVIRMPAIKTYQSRGAGMDKAPKQPQPLLAPANNAETLTHTVPTKNSRAPMRAHRKPG